MQERVVLTGLSSDMWTSEHNGVMTDFVMDTSKQVLLIYLDEQNGLMTCSTFPAFDVAEMAYFAREMHNHGELCGGTSVWHYPWNICGWLVEDHAWTLCTHLLRESAMTR